jgi:hypothetical protein
MASEVDRLGLIAVTLCFVLVHLLRERLAPDLLSRFQALATICRSESTPAVIQAIRNCAFF